MKLLSFENRKKFSHPEWSYQASIYEVNLRQYTPEGTFKALEAQLPRLADMGIRILWFMPITPISREGRLGTLGSYYAAQDYNAANPEFGTIADFSALVVAAHRLGLKVILDFVGNHTGNDHRWLQEHPDYYVHNLDGSVLHPHGWNDVSQLNFENREVWKALANAMEFWVRQCDIDGFRCDMAHLVPLELWYEARIQIEKTKAGLFWLAECEEPAYHQVFDATYTWKWMHATEDFYHGRINLFELLKNLFSYSVTFPCDAFRIFFTSNHDENSWNGTEYEKYGNAAKLFAVFSFTWRGIPMVYSGQELPNLKRLKFFEKDTIEWNDDIQLHNFYKTLTGLKSRNKALMAGGEVYTTIISNENDTRVLAYLQTGANGDEVLTLLNCSEGDLRFEVTNLSGQFKNVFDGSLITFTGNTGVNIASWSFVLLERI